MGNAIKAAASKTLNFFKKVGSIIKTGVKKVAEVLKTGVNKVAKVFVNTVSTVQVKNVNNRITNKNHFFNTFSNAFQINQNHTVRLSAKVYKTNQSQDKSIIDFKDNDNEEIRFLSQS